MVVVMVVAAGLEMCQSMAWARRDMQRLHGNIWDEGVDGSTGWDRTGSGILGLVPSQSKERQRWGQAETEADREGMGMNEALTCRIARQTTSNASGPKGRGAGLNWGVRWRKTLGPLGTRYLTRRTQLSQSQSTASFSRCLVLPHCLLGPSYGNIVVGWVVVPGVGICHRTA